MKFFRKEGYEVISPEQYTVEEQLGFLKDAKEVACIEGTLSHLVLFSSRGIKLTTLSRSHELHPLQLMIDEQKQIKRIAIDPIMSFLPVSLNEGGSYIGPNPNWKQYLADTGKECEEKWQDEVWNEWIKVWAKVYSKPQWFRNIKNQDFFELFNNIYYWAYGTRLERAKFPVPSNLVTYASYEKLADRYQLCKEKMLKERLAGRGVRKLVDVFDSVSNIISNSEIGAITDDFHKEFDREFLYYSVHAAYQGWEDDVLENELAGDLGSARQIEAFRINSYGVLDLEYAAYVDGYDWILKENGGVAGTEGKGKPIRLFYIKLKGEAALKYDVLYRAHVGDECTKWYSNGEITDTFQWKYIEAIEIHLELKDKSFEEAPNRIVREIMWLKEENNKLANMNQKISSSCLRRITAPLKWIRDKIALNRL